jgi:Zn-dependent protease with chaperone function
MEKKWAIIDHKKIVLNNRKLQHYFIVEGESSAAWHNKGDIYFNDDFLGILREKEKKAAIYHERGHFKIINKTLLIVSNISASFFAALLVYAIILFFSIKFFILSLLCRLFDIIFEYIYVVALVN